MKLFRGDTKGNKTLPEKYATDGIFSKQLNSGDDPEPQKKYGWLKTISSHIHPSSVEEKFIYNTTQYLSFSTDREIVMNYLATKQKYTLLSTDRHNADCYLFQFDIPMEILKETGQGTYIFNYSCKYEKTKYDPKFTSHIASMHRCNICSANPSYIHKLLIIDAETFLQDKQDVYHQQYSNAKRDREWLLMPADPMVGQSYSVGYQSRIPLSNHWTVDFFKHFKPT